MSKEDRHHNKEPLEHYVTARIADANESGASAAYRATKNPTQKDVDRLRSPDSTRNTNEWHVKAPSVLMYNNAQCKEGFPDVSAPLTAEHLADQEFLVRKSLAADALWSSFLGKENVAKTRHWQGSFVTGEQEQHYMASRIATDVETLDKCTDTSHGKELPKRDPLTQYHGKDIVNGEVEGKPIVGLGASAAIAMLVGSPDLHPGNFALRKEADKIQVFKFDNKFDLGACERFSKQFLDSEVLATLDNNVTENKQAYEYYDAVHSAMASDPNAEAVFKKEQQEFMAIVNGYNGADKWEKLVEYVEQSQTFSALDENDIPHIENYTSAQDVLSEYEGLRDLFHNGMVNAETEKAKGLPPLLPSLNTPGSLDTMLQDVFPNAHEYQQGDALSSDQHVFNFPFANDFAQAPHVKGEFLDTMYLITHADKNRVAGLIESTMGTSPEAQAVSSQLETNIEKLRAGMEQCPEYQQHVGQHKARLDAKVVEVNQTLDEKAVEFGPKGPSVGSPNLSVASPSVSGTITPDPLSVTSSNSISGDVLAEAKKLAPRFDSAGNHSDKENKQQDPSRRINRSNSSPNLIGH